jgi:Oxidoreductase FAD-binding domain
VEKTAVSHNVTKFKFALDHDKQLLGLPTGKHMLIRKKHTNKEGMEEMVMRAYTPITADETRGYFELVVKIYYANTHPRFPDGGKFSQVPPSLVHADVLGWVCYRVVTAAWRGFSHCATWPITLSHGHHLSVCLCAVLRTHVKACSSHSCVAVRRGAATGTSCCRSCKAWRWVTLWR